MLDFEPYRGIARQCGADEISLKRSLDTGRLYLWHIEHGGHAPVLYLVPVNLEHVCDEKLVRTYHENMGYQFGVDLSKRDYAI